MPSSTGTSAQDVPKKKPYVRTDYLLFRESCSSRWIKEAVGLEDSKKRLAAFVRNANAVIWSFQKEFPTEGVKLRDYFRSVRVFNAHALGLRDDVPGKLAVGIYSFDRKTGRITDTNIGVLQRSGSNSGEFVTYWKFSEENFVEIDWKSVYREVDRVVANVNSAVLRSFGDRDSENFLLF